MSDRDYDELINKLEAIIYPIVFFSRRSYERLWNHPVT